MYYSLRALPKISSDKGFQKAENDVQIEQKSPVNIQIKKSKEKKNQPGILNHREDNEEVPSNCKSQHSHL